MASVFLWLLIISDSFSGKYSVVGPVNKTDQVLIVRKIEISFWRLLQITVQIIGTDFEFFCNLFFFAKRLLPSIMMATCFGRSGSSCKVIKIRPSLILLLLQLDVYLLLQHIYL